MHVAIQVVCSHYMLTASMEYLWYVKFWHLCFKLDQLIKWMTKRQAMVLRINFLWYNGFIFRQQSPFLWEKPGHICLVLVGLTAGRLADEIWVDFKICRILYRFNYLDFCFIDISAMLLIVLEVNFSQFFSKCILGCVLRCIKVGCHFFMLIHTIRY